MSGKRRRHPRRGGCNTWHLEKTFSWCQEKQADRRAELNYLLDTFGITNPAHLTRAGR
jgi:hypothetical protein